MKQQYLNEASTKKLPSAVGPEGRPTVDPYGYVDPKEMISGEKNEIKLDQAQQLLFDVELEISNLSITLNYLNHATGYEKELAIVQGFMENLKDAQTKIKERIDELKSKIDDLRHSEPTMPDNILQLFQHIEKNCASYFKLIRRNGLVLYRGTKKYIDAYVGKSWEDRVPKDSKKTVQKLFDKMLLQLGFVALRSNSIYTISHYYTAKSYGKVYLIFPIDGLSHYTYTNNTDLTLTNLDNIHVDKSRALVWMKPFLSWAISKNKELQANNGSKSDILDISHIINIFTDHIQYPWKNHSFIINNILSNKKHWLQKGVPPELLKIKYQDLVTVDSFNKQFQPNQTDLGNALHNGCEVYINGAYYALSYDKFNKFFELYLNQTE